MAADRLSVSHTLSNLLCVYIPPGPKTTEYRVALFLLRNRVALFISTSAFFFCFGIINQHITGKNTEENKGTTGDIRSFLAYVVL